MRTFCCPTTLQYDAKGNGFYVFDFSAKAQVEWTSIGSLRVDDESPRALKQLDRSTFDLDAEPTADENETRYDVKLS